MDDVVLPLAYSAELTPLFALTPVYDWSQGWLSPLEKSLLSQNLEKQDLHLRFSIAEGADNSSENFAKKQAEANTDIPQNAPKEISKDATIKEEIKKEVKEEIYNYLEFKKTFKSNPNDFSFVQNILSAMPLEKITIDIKTNTEQPLRATDLLKNFGRQLKEDVLFLKERKPKKNSNNSFDNFIEKEKNIFIHPKAKVSSLSSLETNSHSDIIVIDEGAEVSAFSILRAPLYIGKYAVVDKAMIANSRIGNFCRVGGEVSDTVMAAFSNKHHEGFVGHSLIGSWVNLGALTTTSDLKNNYGKIQLQYQGQNIPTNTIKFGSIMGDFVKTAIGTMLNTGTILDSGTLLFEGRPTQKYYPPFFWGGKNPTYYEWQRFVKDAALVMARRNVVLHSYQEKKLHELWQSFFSTNK